MQAKETKFQELIEGTKQFVVPLFQRTYSWEERQWKTLLDDIKELYSMENPRSHFIGSIVNIPAFSVPEGVSKFLLIDGQQRITTLFIILTVLRDISKNDGTSLSEEITNTLLINQYKKDLDYFKLLPTQYDRNAFKGVLNSDFQENSRITDAYNYFIKEIKKAKLVPENVKNIITTYFSTVSITLDKDDNPYLVFESLNAKGSPLTQADLIRNYFFMLIHVDKQDNFYSNFWEPMYKSLGKDLTEFIRHFLMKDGGNVRQSDIYYELKNKVHVDNVEEYLSTIYNFSKYYEKLINPDKEDDNEIKKYLIRLNKLEVTTSYPLLLYFYDNYYNGSLKQSEFVNILKILENYLIRRYVCNYPTNQLNKTFGSIQPILKNTSLSLLEELKKILQSKKYPKDTEFKSSFSDMKFYGGGDKITKTKFILEAIEESYHHKEVVSYDNLSIEHIMPQTLSNEWKKELGIEWEDIHNLYTHSIGNLTLTAYNPELSNSTFIEKKKIYAKSKLEINKYFSDIPLWNDSTITKRSEDLAEQALTIWNYFGEVTIPDTTSTVTNTKPIYLNILGFKYKVDSWGDVLIKTLDFLCDVEPKYFETLQHSPSFGKYLSKDKDNFIRYKQLKNGYYVEVNFSAEKTKKLCYLLIEQLDLTQDDWDVETY